MKAVVLRGITPADQVFLEEKEIPQVQPGWVLVKIKAFGMNHSEQILRLSEIEGPYIQKPLTPGIECVGEVAHPSDSNFQVGQKVVALMGGLGRSFDGSYAEYALIPVKQVFTIDSDLPWRSLAAVPETYYTAWGSLSDCLQLKPVDRLLIRGATSALGYASLQLAKALGAYVIATTHREDKLPLLADADQAIIDNERLAGTLSSVNKVLELVGPKTLRDSLQTVEKGGIICNTGVLGGIYALDGFDPIKEIPNGVYLTGFFSNYPSQAVIDDIFNFIKDHQLQPRFGASFKFAHIQEACLAQDKGTVDGKIVVEI